jgi:hypothetical protein
MRIHMTRQDLSLGEFRFIRGVPRRLMAPLF